jgi:hypothetical protein
MRALAAILLLVPQLAYADDTFEQRAQAAVHIAHADDIVWSQAAKCDDRDYVQQRQCRLVSDSAARRVNGAEALLVDGDADALAIERWNPAKKSARVTLAGCIRCGGISVDGTTWYLVAKGAAPPRFEGGKLRAALVHDNGRPFADDAAATVWAKSVANHRVQWLVKRPHGWNLIGKDGIELDIVGYRVFNPCDGSIILASPPSSAVAPDKKACTEGDPVGVASPDGFDTLTPAMVQTAMKPVVDAANKCFAQYKINGKTKLDLLISGDGSVVRWEQHGDFDDTATGQCIDTAMRTVTFPKSKKATTKIGYPIELP